MVKFYVRRIMIDKKMTIDEVPEKWREKVRAEIEKAEQIAQGASSDAPFLACEMTPFVV